MRGRGHGKQLLLHLANIAVERGYSRYEWTVLNWNTPSIEFYESLGAVPMSEWTTYRLEGAGLHAATQREEGIRDPRQVRGHLPHLISHRRFKEFLCLSLTTS